MSESRLPASSSADMEAASRARINKLLRVALILSVATAIEFVIAFGLEAGVVKTVIFVLLTLLKAFYIVGEFMHLSHERRTLIWTIIFPVIFIALLIFILIYESALIVHAH